MRRIRYFCTMIFAVMLGCGDSKEPPSAQDTSPLAVEDWKDFPVALKYDPVTFERLKQHDPELRTEKGWNEFMVNTVVPERKQDLPQRDAASP